MSIAYLNEVKDVKHGTNGAILARVKLEVSPLRSVKVRTPKEEGKSYGYDLPFGSYMKDGQAKYTKPIYPVNAADIQKAVQEQVQAGNIRRLPNPVEGVEGYVDLETAQVWVDVTLTANGNLLFPSQVDKKDNTKSYMVIPVKKDDPIREEIIAAIKAAV